MTKKAFSSLLLIYILCTSWCSAQYQGYQKVDEPTKHEVVTAVVTAATAVESMVIPFQQAKSSSMLADKVISYGEMSYKNGNLLRWAYTRPASYAIIINPRGAFFKTGNKSTQNKMIGTLGNLMLSIINGKAFAPQGHFMVTCYEGADLLLLLHPHGGELKKTYTAIEVYLHQDTHTAHKVVLKEVNGDSTVITLGEPQRNVMIADTAFQE